MLDCVQERGKQALHYTSLLMALKKLVYSSAVMSLALRVQMGLVWFNNSQSQTVLVTVLVLGFSSAINIISTW